MRLLSRRLVFGGALVFAGLMPLATASAQTDPTPPETAAPTETGVPESPPPAPVTTVAIVESTTPRTTTTLVPCEKTADLAVIFVGRPVVRTGNIVSFNVDSVVQGDLKGDTTTVKFPLDDRFIFDGKPYRVAASFDAESGTLVSKVRPPRNTPVHCLALDKVFTEHADGTPIETGIFSGMSGNWKKVPLALLEPLGVVIGVLFVLVILKHSFGWIFRRIFDRAVRRVSRSRRPHSADL
jgi:hypothetical protein